MQRLTRRIAPGPITVLGGGLLIVLVIAPASAQVFRSGIDLVALTVTVTDERGNSVSALAAEHFAVYEDGVEQQISLFGATDVPLDVALVADASISMSLELPAVQDGAQALLDRLRPGDRAAMIVVRGQVETASPLSSDLVAVRAAIRNMRASGSTALYDGIYISLRQFERERQRHPERRRQALVVFTDGVDTSSHVEYDDVVALARALDVTIYTITLQKQTPDQIVLDDRHPPRWLMRTLSFETGGLSFITAEPSEMRPIYDTIARELVSQYALAYVAPPGGNGRTFRRVSIRLLPPAHGVARTRTGYTVRPARAGSSGDRPGE